MGLVIEGNDIGMGENDLQMITSTQLEDFLGGIMVMESKRMG